MDHPQTRSAGGLEQDEPVVEKKPSYMNRVKAKARKIRDSIGSKMQNHDHELEEEDHFDQDAPENEPEIHVEPKHESPAFKTGSDKLNSETTPSNLAEHGDAETTREYGEAGVPGPKRYSSEHAESCPTGLNFGEKSNTDQTKSNLGVRSSAEEPKTDLDVTSTPLEVEKAAVISELDSRPTLDFDEPSVEVPLEAEKTAVVSELNSTIHRVDSEKPYKWNLESNLEVSPELEAEKAAVITEINSSIPRMVSEKPYTSSMEANSSESTPLEVDKENVAPTWMDFEKENEEQATDQFGIGASEIHHSEVTGLTDAGAKDADVEPMTQSFRGIDITEKPESTITGTEGNENTEDFYEAKSDSMNVDEEPNVNPIYTEKKPSAPAAIANTAASTIIGTAISAKDAVASKLGYNGNDTVTKDAKAMDTDGSRSIDEETKSSTEYLAPVYEKFGGAGTGDVGTEKDTSSVAGTGTEEGVGLATEHNTGGTVKDYLVEKLSPADEGKPLLEVFSEVMHKPKEEFPEKVAENMDKVTDSAEVTKRLGTDERGYERDEEESFGTDGGSLGGGGSFGGGPGGMESPAASKMGEQVREHDTGASESPEVAARLGTDERGYERDDDDSFGADAISTGRGIESPTASMGMVDRAKGLVNYYWYGTETDVKPDENETGAKLDDEVRKVADAGAERRKNERHETSTTGVVGEN
ncbi:low-temperature-induced 65 kDa protein-like isoform X2 [Papaver somniferum]|uniref:low-temperature-induced 65 kDa protein-like isoform X2 n=1 Tax=Papaver somniferum TaxID=3469 RepID=UPI000E6FA2C3|nr:low-temperature-induced 65 kDa protein-like isoform X2 [Papaver somniferum]